MIDFFISRHRVQQCIRILLASFSLLLSFSGQGAAEMVSLQQNPVRFGIRSFDDFSGRNIAPAFYDAQETYQNIPPQEKKIHRPVAGLRKFRAGEEVYSVLSRRNSLAHSVPSTGIPTRRTSRIRGKDMTVVKLRHGENVLAMDFLLNGARSSVIQN